MKKLILALMALMISFNVVIASETSDVDCSAIIQSGSDVQTSADVSSDSGSDTER